MTSKIIELDGKRVIVALTEDGTPVAQLYKEDPAAPPEPKGKTPPAGIRDKIMLSDWLQKQGHIRGSEEYNAQLAAYGADLPLEFNDHKPLR